MVIPTPCHCCGWLKIWNSSPRLCWRRPMLTVVSFPVLFLGTVAGFIASAPSGRTARLPARAKAEPGQFWADVTKGIRIYTRTPAACAG